ncbi:LEA type 2 family protein [Chloracidobacterium sp. MS 40/45]|uniref:NDR1/HIN1-like protein n=1 Tax=Chloracidobacterium aggregatum TaxID=2851959 RepID=UPI001B8C169F|nr:LEA type 2 family protein [Chloracidobacterium aggregatum]QUW00833.1 LEA type 2 family protein [Chloracidobacterium sp. MS 40/45]
MDGQGLRRRQFLRYATSGVCGSVCGLLAAGLTDTGLAEAGVLPAADEGKLPKGFREPTLTLEELEVRQVDYPLADVLAHIAIDNPNQALTLSKLTYRIVLNGVECGTGEHPEKLTLPKKAALALSLPITADLSSVPHLGINTLLQSRLGEGVFINYVIHVAFEVSVLWLFKRHVKARLTGRLPLREVLGKLSLP